MALVTDQLIDEKWTLFLDRDGVINQRIYNGYVRTPEEFIFLEGVLESFKVFSKVFNRIIIVTNQQGIAKGIMTVEQLHKVHYHMLIEIEKAGGRIDNIYFCPTLKSQKPNCRKPDGAMSKWAKNDFPDIDFRRSVMVGDMPSDIQFGNDLEMTTVWINNNAELGNTDATYIYFNLNGVAKDLLMGCLK